MATYQEDARKRAAGNEDRVNLLDLAPIRASGWEEREERVVLVRPHPTSKGLRAPLDWLVYLLAARRLNLDDFGSFCWLRMNGERTAGEIATLLRAPFRNRRGARGGATRQVHSHAAARRARSNTRDRRRPRCFMTSAALPFFYCPSSSGRSVGSQLERDDSAT